MARDETRFKVLACGRRWGKTRLGSLSCVTIGAQGGLAWWVAPSYKTAAVGWRAISNLGIQIPGAVRRDSDRQVRFPGGGVVEIRSADDPDSLRGDGLDHVVLDECAFIQERAWTEALRPALSDRQGTAMFISTPKGHNWFWRNWMLGQSGDHEWQSYQFPTSDNPYILASEIEAAKQLLPERIYNQEYLALFIDDSGGVFRHVLDCATATEQSRQDGHQYVVGVDLARKVDFTVITVLDMSVDPVQMVYMDRFNQVDWNIQVSRIKAVVERYQAEQVVVDQTGVGDPIVEQLRRELFQ